MYHTLHVFIMATFSLKSLAAMGLVVCASAGFDEDHFVKKINSKPGILWRAEAGALKGRDLKTLSGVNAESWGAVQKLPRADFSHINDEDIPDSFDSETNWPECAKVIGDIRDQSMCGCCCKFQETEALTDTVFRSPTKY